MNRLQLPKLTARRCLACSVPAAIVISTMVLPLAPLVVQGLIGVMILWFPVAFFLGF